MTIVDPSKFEPSYLFNMIGEHNRLKVIRCLMEREHTVGEIRLKTKMEKTLLSKHLKVLKTAGLVYASRSGRNVYYQMNPRVLKPGQERSLFLQCCEIKLRPE